MVKHFAALGVVLVLLPSVGLAQSLTDAAKFETLTPQSPSAHSQWQESYDAAESRKNSAKRKMYIGLGAVGGGFLIAAAYGTGDDRLNSEEFTTGMLINAGGGVVFVWGLMQYLDANGDMNRLNDQRPSAGPTASLTLTRHQAIEIGGGRNPTVAYALSW